MTIFENDIKLLESERLNDNPDGGGRLTGTEVEDNEANNLFPDISELDRTIGRVQLRKAYVAVLSPNTDTYFGSHVIIDDAPNDANVHATLFDTQSWTDERADARDRLESYVIAGPESRMHLFGDQLEGQQTIRTLQRLEAPLPEAGDVFALRVEEPADGVSVGDQQFVRATGINDSERVFEDQQGTYTRREIIIEISEPLRQTFPGGQASRHSGHDSPTLLRESQVADAARYYSIQPVEEAAETGDIELKIPSLMVPLVPSTEAEEAVTDERGAGDVLVPVETGGEIVEVPDVAQTDRIEVQLANRQFTYVRSLTPAPRPGTLTVAYRSQGRWSTMADNGDGNLEGVGAGSIDYDTGTAQITLAELPDVPSGIVFTWGANASQFDDAAGEAWATITDPEYSIDLDNEAEPNSVQVEYVSDGTTYTLTDDGDGNLTGAGAGTGTVTYIRRTLVIDGQTEILPPRVRFVPDHVPEPGSSIQITADEPDASEETFSGLTPDANGEVQFTLGNAVKEGSLVVAWRGQRSAQWAGTRSGRSSNDTAIRREAQADAAGTLRDSEGTIVGSVNYTNGEVTLQVERDYSYTWERRSGNGFDLTIEEESATETETLDGSVRARYADPTTPPDPEFTQIEDVGDTGVEVNLLGLNTNLTMMSGTLRFSWGGVTYADNDGLLRRDPDGDNVDAGTVNYVTGAARITNLPADTSGNIDIMQLVVGRHQITTTAAAFRTPGPQRDGSLIVQAITEDGDQRTATADLGGVLDEAGISGQVDAETGFVEIEVDTPIIPGTIRYSTVAVSFIPIDADLLGLDPIRLPQDGRVPMARVGDVAVIHHTGTEDLGSGDTQTNLPFERLSHIHVRDANGDRVPDDDLILDLDAGTVEVDQSTDSPAPFEAEYRIEDMRLIADVQITGVIRVASQLSHDFPLGETWLSTALLYGDLQANWTTPFSQETWTGEWSDDVIGDETTAQYNSVDFPIAVTNEGAIQERWVCIFNTNSTVDVIGEIVGQILTNVDINVDIAPINPNTDVPYFTIPSDGWGGGWSVGNVLRFNTTAANRPLWIARTITTGDEEEDDDSFRLQLRGDAN